MKRKISTKKAAFLGVLGVLMILFTIKAAIASTTTLPFSDNFTRADDPTYIGGNWTDSIERVTGIPASNADSELLNNMAYLRLKQNYAWESYGWVQFDGYDLNNISADIQTLQFGSHSYVVVAAQYLNSTNATLGYIRYMFYGPSVNCGTNTSTTVQYYCEQKSSGYTGTDTFAMNNLKEIAATQLTGVDFSKVTSVRLWIEADIGANGVTTAFYADNVTATATTTKLVFINYTGANTGTDYSSTMNCSEGGVEVEHTGTAYLLEPGAHNFSCVNGDGYASFEHNFTVVDNNDEFNVSVEEYGAQFSFYDQETGAFLNTTTIAVEFIGDSFAQNYTTTNGTLSVVNLSLDNFTVRYVASGYEAAFFYFEMDTTTATYAYNLTLLNSTSASTGTITVKDTLNTLLEGAYVYVMRYDIATNSFFTTEIVQTNFEGVTQASWTLNDEYYKFIVVYEGEVRLETEPSYLYGTDITFIVDLGLSGFDDFIAENGLSGDVEWLNASSIASFTWNDQNSVATKGCVYIYERVGDTETTMNSTCTTGSTGTNYVGATLESNRLYYVRGYVTIDGYDYLVDEEIIDMYDDAPRQQFGLYMLLFIEIIVILIGVWWMLELAIFLGTLFPLIFSITGFIALGLDVTVPVFVLGLVAIGIIQYGRRRG